MTPALTCDELPVGNRTYCGCVTCDRVFGSLGLFDKHFLRRKVEGQQYRPAARCRTDAELRSLGWALNGRGAWMGSEDAASRLRTPPRGGRHGKEGRVRAGTAER